nr:hypothetical protein [Sedimentibacter sp.]
MKKISKKMSILAIIICISIIAVLFLSEFFIITHIDHDCKGENCHTCLQIQSAQNAIRQLTAGVGFVNFLLSVIVLHFCISIAKSIFICNNSLITLKVRLND